MARIKCQSSPSIGNTSCRSVSRETDKHIYHLFIAFAGKREKGAKPPYKQLHPPTPPRIHTPIHDLEVYHFRKVVDCKANCTWHWTYVPCRLSTPPQKKKDQRLNTLTGFNLPTSAVKNKFPSNISRKQIAIGFGFSSFCWTLTKGSRKQKCNGVHCSFSIVHT